MLIDEYTRDRFGHLEVESVDEYYSRLLGIPPVRQYSRARGYFLSFDGRIFTVDRDTKELVYLYTEYPPIKEIIDVGGLALLDVYDTLIFPGSDIHVDNIKNISYGEGLYSDEMIILTKDNLLMRGDATDITQGINSSKQVSPSVSYLRDSLLIYEDGLIERITIDLRTIKLIQVDYELTDTIFIPRPNPITMGESYTLYTLDKNKTPSFHSSTKVLREYYCRRDGTVSEDLATNPEVPITRFLVVRGEPYDGYILSPAFEDEEGNVFLLETFDMIYSPVKLFNENNLNIGRHTKSVNK